MEGLQIYLWRHSNQFSSWSMIDEPQIYKKRYTHAEVAVLASSPEAAREMLIASGDWDGEELQRIEPEVIPLHKARIINTLITF